MDLHIKKLFDSLPKELFNLKIIHHGATVNTVFAGGYFEGRTIKLSNDLIALQVNDEYSDSVSKINKITFENPNQIVSIIVPKYEKWLSKPRELLKYIKSKKYGVKHSRSINGGVFLGKKDSVIFMLEESLRYMEDDFNKGFPYGCLDDQCMFRWLQNRYFDMISVDAFSNYFLFAYPKCLEVDENDWEHFHNFKKNNEKLYIEKNK